MGGPRRMLHVEGPSTGGVILIVSELSDPTAQAVARILSLAGRTYVWSTRGEYPAAASLTYIVSPVQPPSRRWRGGGRTIDLDTVRSIWWRRPTRARAAPSIRAAEVRRYVEASADEVFGAVLDDLECLHVPARRSIVRAAQEKVPQLTLARSLGFEVPETLMTNDPDELLDFYRIHNGKVVTKAAAVRVDPLVRGGYCGYTRRLHPRDLIAAHDVSLCPVTAQVYVEKRLELRVTIVGADLFAAEIHSQSTRQTRVDWRHYDDRYTVHQAHELPDPVARRCRELVDRMGLVYGAIDLVLTPDGRYVFLEINPNGEYQWIEDATGLPISDRIAKLLWELQ